jgi:rhodanese-related sulfurtransferase
MDATASSNNSIPSITAEQLQSALQSEQPPLLIDVRRAPAFAESTQIITGAAYHDPAQLADWAGSLPHGASVVVYCVHGHQVSQGAAQALNERGFSARFLEGGITHWAEGGGAVSPKPAGKPS